MKNRHNTIIYVVIGALLLLSMGGKSSPSKPNPQPHTPGKPMPQPKPQPQPEEPEEPEEPEGPDPDRPDDYPPYDNPSKDLVAIQYNKGWKPCPVPWPVDVRQGHREIANAKPFFAGEHVEKDGASTYPELKYVAEDPHHVSAWIPL